MINAGQLDRLVVIQEKVVVRDAAGGETFTFQVRATVWANVRWLGLRDAVRSDQPIVANMAEVTMRYRTDLQATDRVVVGGVPYDVVSWAPVNRTEGLRVVVRTPETKPT